MFEVELSWRLIELVKFVRETLWLLEWNSSQRGKFERLLHVQYDAGAVKNNSAILGQFGFVAHCSYKRQQAEESRQNELCRIYDVEMLKISQLFNSCGDDGSVEVM